MKKTLVALAALAAAGSSFAQVIISGTFDPTVAITNTSYKNGNSVSNTATGNNGQGTSQITFRGVEDLGGGLSAEFRMENDFQANNGTSLTNFPGSNGGDVWVGLNGGFGKIKLGTPNTPTLSTQAGRNVWGTKIGSGFGGVMGSGKVRQNNSVRYDSPSFGGASIALNYTFGTTADANPTTAIAAAEPVVDLGLFYAAGAINAGLSLWKQANNTTNAGDQITTLHFQYNLGVANVYAGYHTETKTTAAGVDSASAGFNLGVAVPMGAVTLQANYGKLDDKETSNLDRSILGLGVKYDLSKRTSAYARYVNQVNDTNATSAANFVEKITTTLVGVQHNF